MSFPAPVRPEDAELVSEDRVAHLLDMAKEAYDVVVVDTAPHFHATTLATLDRTDRLVLLATLDIPTVKNVKLTMQTLNLLHYPRERVTIVLNRAARPRRAQAGDVERALDMKVGCASPATARSPWPSTAAFRCRCRLRAAASRRPSTSSPTTCSRPRGKQKAPRATPELPKAEKKGGSASRQAGVD